MKKTAVSFSSPGIPSFTELRDRYHQLRQKPILGEMPFSRRFEAALALREELEAHDYYPYRKEVDRFQLAKSDDHAAQGNYLNLASNDYLGFTQDPEVKKTAARYLKDFGIGSGSVPMLAGTYAIHRALEQELAVFTGYEGALLFNSGYSANYGLLSTLLTPHDVALLDTQVHASIIDGCAAANTIYFKHNDPESLKQALRKASSFANKLVIVDGVYSMSGDLACLPELAQVARDASALLMIDESHAIGVMGMEGRGTLSHFDLDTEGTITTGSLGKALGGIGGYVAGPAGLLSLLELNCRSFIFSAALPAATAAGIHAGLRLLQQGGSGHLSRLWSNVRFFREGLLAIGFPETGSRSAILPLRINEDEKLIRLTQALATGHILVNPVFYPVVSRRNSLIRLSVSASHSPQQLTHALEQIERHSSRLGIL
jgi:glycine C-acetyltransferase